MSGSTFDNHPCTLIFQRCHIIKRNSLSWTPRAYSSAPPGSPPRRTVVQEQGNVTAFNTFSDMFEPPSPCTDPFVSAESSPLVAHCYWTAHYLKVSAAPLQQYMWPRVAAVVNLFFVFFKCVHLGSSKYELHRVWHKLDEVCRKDVKDVRELLKAEVAVEWRFVKVPKVWRFLPLKWKPNTKNGCAITSTTKHTNSFISRNHCWSSEPFVFDI